MNYRSLFCWLAITCLVKNLTAQPDQSAQNCWHPGFSIALAGGYGLFTTADKEQRLVMPEVPFPASGKTWNLLDINYSFHNHWGIRFLLSESNANPFREDFHPGLEKKFPAFFVQNISMDYVHRRANQFFMGTTFARSRGRYFLQPTLLLGFSEIHYREASATVKEEGTNQLYTLKFSALKARRRVQSPTVLAGLTGGYFLSERASLCLSVDGTTMKHLVKYNYARTNEIEHIVQQEVVSFTPWQYAVSWKLGLSLFFGKIGPSPLPATNRH